jgi:hypothetical protein
MSGQAIKVDPNANTNQPAQSGNTTVQSQIIAGTTAPTTLRTPIPLEVTTTGDASKGLDVAPQDGVPIVNPSSPFKSVTVTNPNEPWDYAGWNGQAVQNPLDSQYNQNNQLLHVEPSALIRQTQRMDFNADN